MTGRKHRSSMNARPTAPGGRSKSAPVPTETQARERLVGFRSSVGRMTQAEFDAAVAVAASTEDEINDY